MELKVVAKYDGALAASHRLPAYEAAKSFYGVSRVLLMTGYYLAEGKVRHKNFNSEIVGLNLIATRQGSFEAAFELVSVASALTVGGAFAGGVTVSLAKDFIQTILARSIGGTGQPSIEKLEAEGELSPGDMIALVDAIAPAMKKAHEPIGAGADTLKMSIGKKSIVQLDQRSKDYLQVTSYDPTLRTKLFSVGSFNANTGYGRVFDIERGHTVPFQIKGGGLDSKSINIMLESMSSYTRRRWAGADIQSAVAFKYTAQLAADGTEKKVFPEEVAREISELA